MTRRPLRRRTVLALACVAFVMTCARLAAGASADPISVSAYRAGLQDARDAVAAARASAAGARDAELARAHNALDAIAEVRVGDLVYRAPHAPIAELVRARSDESLTRALALIDETLAAVDRAWTGRGLEPVGARAQLDAVLASHDFRRVPDLRDAIAAIARDLVIWLFPGVPQTSVDTRLLGLIAVIIAIVLVGFVVVITARGLRERLVREVALAAEPTDDRPRAPAHLAAADAAVRAGKLREAVRELFLFTLVALEERGALRHDPALTDREVLARAAGLPRAAELAALVSAYERVWYGLREPDPADVERARELARRIAA